MRRDAVLHLEHGADVVDMSMGTEVGGRDLRRRMSFSSPGRRIESVAM